MHGSVVNDYQYATHSDRQKAQKWLTSAPCRFMQSWRILDSSSLMSFCVSSECNKRLFSSAASSAVIGCAVNCASELATSDVQSSSDDSWLFNSCKRHMHTQVNQFSTNKLPNNLAKFICSNMQSIAWTLTIIRRKRITTANVIWR